MVFNACVKFTKNNFISLIFKNKQDNSTIFTIVDLNNFLIVYIRYIQLKLTGFADHWNK